MLLAASTQRTIGWVILAIVFIGAIAWIYFNIRASKAEVGSEIELAPNRNEPLSDETLEGKRLDLNLGAALAMLTIVAVALPVYWLGEPGRHEGRIDDTDRVFTNRGEEIYTEGAQCVNCHGTEGGGGAAPFTLTDDSGEFIAQVTWKAPALNSILSRHSEDEVFHVLDFGRNNIMPAWGAGGGGPLTTQQLEEGIFYLRSVQLTEDELRADVDGGLRTTIANDLGADSGDDSAVDDFLAEVDEVMETARDMAMEDDDVADEVESAGSEEEADEILRVAALELLSMPGEVPGQETYLKYGEYIFANEGTNGTYSCARCHTAGWSIDAASEFTAEENGIDGPLPGYEDGYVQGGGFFGPNLTNGSTLNQFPSASGHADFISNGQTIGQVYGVAGSGGNGQMPGFGERIDDDLGVTYPATLTQDQIDAIVAYERNL